MMPEQKSEAFERCSFLSTMLLIGWQDEKTPIWVKMLDYGRKGELPKWHKWEDVQRNLIGPLCSLAETATLFGNEWRSVENDVIALRNFVESKFTHEEEWLVCSQPQALIDTPLLWVGGNRSFHLVNVLRFKLEAFERVLGILRYHHRAEKMSPRDGVLFTAVNNFCISVVQKGEFAVIWTGTEAEVFYPVDYASRVKSAAKDVNERQEAQRKMVLQQA